MPPRHHYWTIILEGKPTAFRAHTEEELIPTLRQLQVRHPDAVMKWFARGRLWASQDEERADAVAKRRPDSPPAGERRPRAWRPGGEHKDPRDRFKVSRDEKRRRFAQNLRRDRPAPEEGKAPPGSADRPPQLDRPPRAEHPNRPDRPVRLPGASGGPRPNRPGGFARGPSTGRPPAGRPPRFDRPSHADRGVKPPWKRDENRGRNDRPWSRDRPGSPPFGRTPGDRRPPPPGERPGSGHRPPSGRPPNRGAGRPPGGTGRPPGGGGRFGPRPQGGRKPGGGGRKGGGGRGQ
jgi:translation initiation factor IF-2